MEQATQQAAGKKPAHQPASSAAKPATPVTDKLNARAHLRKLFDKVGNTATKEQVFGDYYHVTIRTHLTDLKNPKYAGKAGTMNIVLMTDGTYKRVADAKPAEAKAS